MDVGIKNVGNKGFPDAINTASRDASGKPSFPRITKASASIRRENELKLRGEKKGEAERGKERSVAVSIALPPLFRCRPSPPFATLAPIEHEEEIDEFRLEDEMPMNVGLMHVKVLNGWSNKSFDMLLELLRTAFPMYGYLSVGEVKDVQNDHINILEVVVSHQVDDHIEDDTLCRNDVDPTIVERSIVRHVTDDFIDDVDEHLSHASDDEL
ncbi:uncharacterized protein E5676_scaffold596G00070 [Cucumis melo var. makuwa]|uniref:Uncharacterized protein n=1 Tax=Cucumis melo var. makuwa TaxID=1194695 RepID=A0A5D3BM49_CUCMM|nr:uncharacterized protein E5676_scaffold596G00070 [Cucumis melo var. makuwa]